MAGGLHFGRNFDTLPPVRRTGFLFQNDNCGACAHNRKKLDRVHN